MKNRILLTLALLLSMQPVWSAAVDISYKGLKLNGNMELADGKKLSDGIILMTHGTLAHGRMEIMSSLQEMFKERGISTLSITLGLGISDRQGMYDCKVPHHHKHTDAMDEIGVWLQWLKKQGAKKVTLFGHSRGGNQTAWFASERDDAVVNAVILAAPMTWSKDKWAAGYKKQYGKNLSDLYAKAQGLVKKGKGKELMPHTDFVYCKDTSVDAESFVDYYMVDSRFDTPSLLKKIPKPVLVFAGSEDKIVVGLGDKVKPYVDGKHIQLNTIDGAGHFFRDLNSEDMADAIVDYLEQLK